MEPVMTSLELFPDDGALQEETGSHVAPEPKHRLMVHFEDEVRAYEDAKARSAVLVLMALGGMRRLYWLALGEGKTALATEIQEWWKAEADTHEQGELIK